MRLVKFVTLFFIYFFHVIQGGSSFFCSCSVVKFPNIPPVLRQISSNTSFLFMNPLHATLISIFLRLYSFFLPSVSSFPILPGRDPSSGADICQPNIQFFPGHAPVLFSISGSFIGLFPSTACYPAEPIHTGTHSHSCSHNFGGPGSADCHTVRY